MRFILTENKFILPENNQTSPTKRFILTEATEVELAQNWTTQFLKTFNNTEAALHKYLQWTTTLKLSTPAIQKFKTLSTQISKALTQLEAACSQPEAKIRNSPRKVKKALSATIVAFNKGISAVDETPDNKKALIELNKIVKKLNSYYTKPTWNAFEIKKLKELIARLNYLQWPLFNPSALEEVAREVEDFKKDCNKCLELLTALKRKLPTDFTKFSPQDLSTYQQTVKLVIDSAKVRDIEALSKELTLAKFKVYRNQIKDLKTRYLKITQLASLNIRVEVRPMDAAKDWKAKLASALDKNTVIQEFIYTTWPSDADLVLQIKEALLAECEAYGFNSTGVQVNPFILFISKAYLSRHRGKLTATKYNIIHNLASNHYLTGEDIAGKGAMGHGNLIFCDALYALDPAVIKLYIKKQYGLLRAANRPPEYASNAEMAFNILYKVSEPVTGGATKEALSMTLRPIKEIEQLEAAWIGRVSDEVGLGTAKKVASNAVLLNQINTTENAVKILVALATKFSSNDKISAMVRSCTEAKKLLTKTTTPEEIQKLVASVERLYKLESITASQALSLVKSILESDRFSLSRE